MRVIENAIADAVRWGKDFKGGNTAVTHFGDGGLTVTLYDTAVCRVTPDREVQLATGGHVTSTTRSRITAALVGLGLHGMRPYIRAGQMIVDVSGGTITIGRELTTVHRYGPDYGAELDAIANRANAEIDAIAERIRTDLIVPFCDRNGYKFRAGMGTWVFSTRSGESFSDQNLGSFIWGENLEGIPASLLAALKLRYPLNPGQQLGSLIRDYTPAI